MKAELQTQFEQAKQKLTALLPDSYVREDALDELGELYYAVDAELDQLECNQFEQDFYYLQVPMTYSNDGLFAEELETYLAQHGIEETVKHLRQYQYAEHVLNRMYR